MTTDLTQVARQPTVWSRFSSNGCLQQWLPTVMVAESAALLAVLSKLTANYQPATVFWHSRYISLFYTASVFFLQGVWKANSQPRRFTENTRNIVALISRETAYCRLNVVEGGILASSG